MSDEPTLTDVLDFAQDVIERESDDFSGDVPDHSLRLLAYRAAEPLRTKTDVEMANELSDDEGEIAANEDIFVDELEEQIVEVLFAIATIQTEYDVDIVSAYQDRRESIENVMAFEDELDEDADPEDVRAAMDEHLSDDLEEQMMGGADVADITAGTNVDDDDYDHDQTERSYQ
jgi:hypothetical protein